jgi:HK97 family phage major capsid protein
MTTPTITRIKLPAVRRAVEATQWAIQREKLLAMMEILEVHAAGGSFSAEEIRARSGDRKPVTKSGGAIAVLPLYGVISQRMNLMAEYSGGTSTERFSDDFDAAMADPNVSAIVIDCDSPGGNVSGTPELARRIYDSRGKGKQIVAVANTLMASAAYWICAAADEVVVTPSGEVGSIGVYCIHLDESGLNEQLGLKYTLISAGEHKTEGNPFEPLSPEAFDYAQGQISDINAMFVGDVAKFRGTDVKTVNANFGQGRTFLAKKAVAAGLADKVATLQATLTRLGAKSVGLSGRPTVSALGAGVVASIGEDQEIDPDQEENLCLECGTATLTDTCPNCGYTSSEASEHSARADGAAAVIGSISPDNRPLEAKEQPVANDTLTAAPGGADHTAVIAAERKRGSDIRALCKKHKASEELAEQLVNEGLSVDQAATRILGHVEARGAASPNISVGADREAEKPFKSFGEQLYAVVQASHGRVDPRLKSVNSQALRIAGTPSGMNESVGSEGGFFIQPDLLPGVIDPVYTEDPILSRVTRIPIGSNSNAVKYNVVDETARTTGSRWGGIQMYWLAEADLKIPSAPKLRQMHLELKKLAGLAYLTDELQMDAPAAESLLTRAFQAEISFMLTAAIFQGTGAGQPLGIMKSGALVTQNIEATQTIANTASFISLNIPKMLSRIPASLWSEMIWIYNPELLPYIVNATTGTNGTIPVFMAAGGLTGKPFDTIMGRPAFASEFAEAVGTPGDIMAIVPSQYHIADKGGPQQATSIHVRFLYDESVLRIVYRVDGAPVWRTTLTPYKGANVRSPFVALNTRA